MFFQSIRIFFGNFYDVMYNNKVRVIDTIFLGVMILFIKKSTCNEKQLALDLRFISSFIEKKKIFTNAKKCLLNFIIN